MLDNILYLTDFSQASEAALWFAIKVARIYDGKVYALHVSLPAYDSYKTPKSVPLTIAGEEKSAGTDMERVNAELSGLRHEIIVEKRVEIWLSVEQAIRHLQVNIVVMGTCERKEKQRFSLGSVAKESLHRSPVPVLTIGPRVPKRAYDGARFQRALVAIDFAPESTAAASYAASLAEQNQARLVLLHVRRPPGRKESERRSELSVAEAFHQLDESVSENARLRLSPNVAMEHGEAAERIIETAEKTERTLSF